MDHAGEPEVRCIICGNRSDEHPNAKHDFWNWVAATEILVRHLFWQGYWKVIGIDLLGSYR